MTYRNQSPLNLENVVLRLDDFHLGRSFRVQYIVQVMPIAFAKLIFLWLHSYCKEGSPISQRHPNLTRVARIILKRQKARNKYSTRATTTGTMDIDLVLGRRRIPVCRYISCKVSMHLHRWMCGILILTSKVMKHHQCNITPWNKLKSYAIHKHPLIRNFTFHTYCNFNQSLIWEKTAMMSCLCLISYNDCAHDLHTVEVKLHSEIEATLSIGTIYL